MNGGEVYQLAISCACYMEPYLDALPLNKGIIHVTV